MPGYVLGADASTLGRGAAKTYGVRWDKSSNTRFSRMEDAALFTDPTPSIGSTNGSSQFDNCYPWSDIKLCNVVDGGVTAYLGDSAFSRTPSSGDVMVEIPKFWIKISNTSSYLDIYISDQEQTGFVVSPLHMDRSDGSGVRDKAYISAYTLNSSYRSLSGQTSVVNVTRATARAGCSNRGATYWQYDFTAYWTLALLYLVEYADWDSQGKIGMGIVDNVVSAQVATGDADNVPGHTGTAGTALTATDAAIKYRHVENPWGNLWYFVDGITFSSAAIQIVLNPANFTDTAGSAGTTQLAYSRSTTSGYITAMGVDENYPWAMYPVAAGGTESTYIPDYGNRSASGVVLYVGGGWNNTAAHCGLFMLYGNNTASYTSANISARLLCLP